jgi:hypothetical protein
MNVRWGYVASRHCTQFSRSRKNGLIAFFSRTNELRIGQGGAPCFNIYATTTSLSVLTRVTFAYSWKTNDKPSQFLNKPYFIVLTN